jgi:hypothetical protein
MKSHPATVTPARIRALAEAYGAEPSRWPEAERVPAQAWIAAHPGEARVLLAEACVLDNLLDAWSLPRPAETLRTRILAPAPAIVREARRRSFLLTLGGGAGLAAACLAGVLAAPSLVSSPATSAAPTAIVQASTDDEVLAEVLAGWEAPIADPADPAP